MIFIYYAYGFQSFSKDDRFLPEPLRQRVHAYAKAGTMPQRLAGMWLLQEALTRHSAYSLADVAYAASGRPGIAAANLDFNLTHSGTLVACALTLRGRVGIDAELLQPADWRRYEPWLSGPEQEQIGATTDPSFAFYHCWTRKEAVLKAAGTGMLHNPATINATKEVVRAGGREWYLHALPLHAAYAVHLATDIRDATSQWQEIAL